LIELGRVTRGDVDDDLGVCGGGGGLAMAIWVGGLGTGTPTRLVGTSP
jgi:hypothetical protein